MSDSSTITHALDALFALNAALRNLHLYPPTSNLISTSLIKAYKALRTCADADGGQVVFAESEKRLLIGTVPVSESELAKPQAAAFLQMLLDLKIKRLAFTADLEHAELRSFLETIKSPPDTIARAGGLHSMLSGQNLPHIILDCKRLTVAREGESPASGQGHGEGAPISEGPPSQIDAPGAPIVAGSVQGRAAATPGGGARNDGPLERPNADVVSGEPGGPLGPARKTLRAALKAVMHGDRQAFREPDFVGWLPNAVDQLKKSGKTKTANQLVARLGNELLAADPEDRPAIAEALVTIEARWPAQDSPKAATPQDAAPPKDASREVRQQLAAKLLAWVKMETILTPALAQAIDQLSILAEGHLRAARMGKSQAILETFHRIQTGELAKPAPIRELIDQAVQRLATPGILHGLLGHLLDDDTRERDRAVAMITRLGPGAVDFLLERIQSSENMNERLRIIRILTAMGTSALPQVVHAIQQRPGPWYYLRNLVVILGKIGDESHIPILAPLLHASDSRIQREALNGIGRIGGAAADRVLLPILMEADDELKLRIVELLGRLRSPGAAEPLAAMLRDKPLITTKARTELEAKICTALGHIATRAAITALEEVSRTKGRLGVKSYGVQVIDVARRALAAARSSGG